MAKDLSMPTLHDSKGPQLEGNPQDDGHIIPLK